MAFLINILLVSLALSSLLLLGASRMARCIRLVAFQGVLLGCLTLTVHGEAPSPRVVALGVAIIVLKGFAFPWLLSRVLREADVLREVEPFASYNISLLFGTFALAVCSWASARLPLPHPAASSLVVPVALFATLTGLFLIVTRRKALTQVLGYIVFENGIYVFGAGLVLDTPMLVEMGVLLDVFVAVFVMGIAIFHINREFDHIDSDRLANLADWKA